MNITPISNQQAQGKRFATVRFHDVYDNDLVDRCLEDLEARVSDLKMRQSVLEEANGLLRSQVTHAHQRAEAAEAELERLQAEVPAPAAAQPVEAPAEVEVAPVADSAQTTSRAAARLLEIATSESESLVEEARAEAAELLADARAEADRLAQSTLEEVEARQDELSLRENDAERRVNRLLDIEHQCRTHLATFFQAQLDELGQPTLAETVAAGETELPLAMPGL